MESTHKGTHNQCKYTIHEYHRLHSIPYDKSDKKAKGFLLHYLAKVSGHNQQIFSEYLVSFQTNWIFYGVVVPIGNLMAFQVILEVLKHNLHIRFNWWRYRTNIKVIVCGLCYSALFSV